MSPFRHSLAAVREQRRVSLPRAARAPEIREVSAVTPDGRPCTVRYIAGDDVVSVWVPRTYHAGVQHFSLSLDKLGLVANEWLAWARNEAARDEAHRGRS